MSVGLLLVWKIPLAVCVHNPYNQKGYFRKWKCLRNELIASWKKNLSFAILDFRLASRGRKPPFVVLSSWVRCLVIIRVTMSYIGSPLSVVRNVTSTCLAFNCDVRIYPLRQTFLKFPRHASSQHAGLEADNLGRDQRGVAAILGFPNAKHLEIIRLINLKCTSTDCECVQKTSR